jgi:23S rRNA (cytidine2498-2'-O)-methyltransferase
MTQTAYLAPEGLEQDLEREILRHSDLKIHHHMERLFIVVGPAKRLAFAQQTWANPQCEEIESISQAAKLLRSRGKLWAPYSHTLHRRMTLIQEQLPKIHSEPQVFPQPAPDRRLGAWTLQDETTLWFSAETDSPYPLGEVNFAEDKSAPSRAYLKLWEFFTLTGQRPKPQETCLDLGSSPGGWTWVLAGLGCQVLSIDKAPLAAEVSTLSNVQ